MKAFTPQEVYAFSQATGDDNAIHLTERPVVQGLLLWQELFSKLGEPSRMEVIFQEPVHAGEGIYLEEEQHEQRNQSNFTFCPGNPGQPSQFHPGPDHQRRLRGTAGRIGLHFFPLPFTPAMVTALTIMVNLVGFLKTPKQAAVILGIYLLLGMVGSPSL